MHALASGHETDTSELGPLAPREVGGLLAAPRQVPALHCSTSAVSGTPDDCQLPTARHAVGVGHDTDERTWAVPATAVVVGAQVVPLKAIARACGTKGLTVSQVPTAMHWVADAQETPRS